MMKAEEPKSKANKSITTYLQTPKSIEFASSASGKVSAAKCKRCAEILLPAIWRRDCGLRNLHPASQGRL